jgi:hypothetical protein
VITRPAGGQRWTAPASTRSLVWHGRAAVAFARYKSLSMAVADCRTSRADSEQSAVFHFLTAPADRIAYVRQVAHA